MTRVESDAVRPSRALRVLVTGGSGFIGTHMVVALQLQGATVLNLDIAPPKLDGHRPVWIEADLLDRERTIGIVEEFRPTLIVNLAAVADISKGGDALRVNTEGLANLIDVARGMAAPPHLVHASTQLVVGPGHTPSGPRDYAPYTEYGESKAKSEELLWTTAENILWTVVRPTTVWGPWHATFGGSIWKYLERRWYLLPTGVDPVRSYGYVGNVVDQILKIHDVNPALVDHKVFYVGDDPIRSSVWLDGFSEAFTGKPVRRVPGVLLSLAAEIGEASRRVGGPSPINKGRLYRMSTDYPVPMQPTFDVLGRGSVPMREGILESVQWQHAQARR